MDTGTANWVDKHSGILRIPIGDVDLMRLDIASMIAATCGQMPRFQRSAKTGSAGRLSRFSLMWCAAPRRISRGEPANRAVMSSAEPRLRPLGPSSRRTYAVWHSGPYEQARSRRPPMRVPGDQGAETPSPRLPSN